MHIWWKRVINNISKSISRHWLMYVLFCPLCLMAVLLFLVFSSTRWEWMRTDLFCNPLPEIKNSPPVTFVAGRGSTHIAIHLQMQRRPWQPIHSKEDTVYQTRARVLFIDSQTSLCTNIKGGDKNRISLTGKSLSKNTQFYAMYWSWGERFSKRATKRLRLNGYTQRARALSTNSPVRSFGRNQFRRIFNEHFTHSYTSLSWSHWLFAGWYSPRKGDTLLGPQSAWV